MVFMLVLVSKRHRERYSNVLMQKKKIFENDG